MVACKFSHITLFKRWHFNQWQCPCVNHNVIYTRRISKYYCKKARHRKYFMKKLSIPWQWCMNISYFGKKYATKLSYVWNDQYVFSLDCLSNSTSFITIRSLWSAGHMDWHELTNWKLTYDINEPSWRLSDLANTRKFITHTHFFIRAYTWPPCYNHVVLCRLMSWK